MFFDLQHTFPIDRETYLRDVFFSKDFQVFMDKELRFGERQVIELHDDELLWTQYQRINADWDLPLVLQKIIKQKSFFYFERSRFDKQTHKMAWTISTPLLSKLDVQGEIWISEHQQHTTRRVFGDIQVSLFGVGGLAEKIIAQGIQDNYEKVALATRRWLELPKHHKSSSH